ncbi:MAG: 16S rRNA (adenine(1518)-N(6)/adenine(1519)-N(6))-dimethyltransferase RsmA [Candidatus Paceibacterota bacterium]|jgi:16S rRNA (adenine1518-N6/adenine1519-N6)-dimethyltransferase
MQIKNHKAKKSLGQNFLKSELALRKIIEAGEIKSDDVILEIGPGKGALTKKLLEKSGTVIAVEKDRELFEFLKEKFEKEILENKLILINEDILDFNINQVIQKFFSGPRFSGSLSRPDHSKNFESPDFKIIANIPYNITGAILKKFLGGLHQPELMVLMVQHEVAKRIVGKGSNPSTPLRVKESILSISVKAYGEPKMIMKVDKRYFSPAPKVDSAIISIKNISREKFTSPQPSPYKREGGNGTVQNKSLNNQIFEEKFWEIVKAGFAHKRKKLSSNLKNVCQSLALADLKNKRAEDLTLEDWIILASKAGKNQPLE